MAENYDVVAVGSGFVTTFFLHRYLEKAPRNARVLILERGARVPHADRVLNRGTLGEEEDNSYLNESAGEKPWIFSFGLGGTSQSWEASTPRMLPSDFRLQTIYGVGADWPISYNDLEESYCDAEDIMGVAGPSEDSPFPRSRPYPQRPHTFSLPDQTLKEALPNHFFAAPSARPTESLSDRAKCCNSSVCTLCPVDAKFTILNGMQSVLKDPRVRVRTGAEVTRIQVQNGVATGATYRTSSGETTANGDTVVLGANAIFNPFLLLKSGLDYGPVGEGLIEQYSSTFLLQLEDMDNFQGSTATTGHGYSLHDGPRRSEFAAGLIETSNRPEVQPVRGRWLQFLRMKVIFEDLRDVKNSVSVSSSDPDKPQVVFEGRSNYTQRAIDATPLRISNVIGALPVERMRRVHYAHQTESNNLGTTVMGTDPASSVVDEGSVHHQIRNLVVLGGSTFPTAAPANPTLTISALALFAAEKMFG
ncbi:MAG: GMC family oxidoreductase [Candidatus Eisenbacteria bacterium]|uniref:GMC family oxidoreductase n=1 Tax=Eiseniibacteriota bacterium TaxID=2212470 RepID=A0A7Y2EAE0_UNCEI|nr:GMC family oxidoreductase [Candidatus Eisenbacteria bacterium]